MNDDFGFTFEESTHELVSKIKNESAVNESELVKWKSKCSEMHSMIMPLLNNLKKNPDKPTIVWPNREEKINEFIKKLNDVLER
jgi:hypothetical protein